MMSRLLALVVWLLGSGAVALAGLLLLLILVRPAAAQRCDGGQCDSRCSSMSPLACGDINHGVETCSQTGNQQCCSGCHCRINNTTGNCECQ
jgi:hypothetical protein